MTTSGTTSDNECQRVTIPANFTFQIKEEPTTKHPKENFLNLEEDLWRRPIELRAETSTQKEILTVRRRNCRSSCSQIFTKIVFLKSLQYSPFNRFAGFQACNFLKKGLQDSNYFDTTFTFSGQLFLQNSCWFLLFQNSHFFAGVIFSEYLLFWSENSIEQPHLDNRRFFTAVTFRNNYFLGRTI